MTLKGAGFGEMGENVIMDKLSVRGPPGGGLGQLSGEMLGRGLWA